MFNLTVDEAHTFYVGENGWLVHNCGPGLDDLSKAAGASSGKGGLSMRGGHCKNMVTVQAAHFLAPGVRMV